MSEKEKICVSYEVNTLIGKLEKELEEECHYLEDGYYVGILEEEIEKLQQENNQLKEDKKKAREFIKENGCYDKDVKKCCDDLNYDECDKLLKILGDKENED